MAAAAGCGRGRRDGAVTEHARSLATVAAALLLESLDGETSLIGPAEGPGDPEVAAILEDIAAWARAALGQSAVPILWRILSRNAHYLGATWRKEVALMRDGALPARDKRRVALAVAMATRGRYMIEYYTRALRQAATPTAISSRFSESSTTTRR